MGRYLMVVLLIPYTVLAVNLLFPGEGFLFLGDYPIFGEHGVSLGIGEDFLGVGYSYRTSKYLETTTGGFFKVKLKTKWERFEGSVLVGDGWRVFLEYETKDFIPFPRENLMIFSLGSDGMFRMWNSYSKMNMLGLNLFSRSLGFTKDTDVSFSTNAVGYLGISLGYNSFGENRIAGVYIPTGRWDEGFLMGGWWEDGLVLGASGRSEFDLESVDLELLWSMAVKGRELNYFLGFNVKVGRSNLTVIFEDGSLGLMIYE